MATGWTALQRLIQEWKLLRWWRAVWKFSNSEQTVPALNAIPHGVWLARCGSRLVETSSLSRKAGVVGGNGSELGGGSVRIHRQEMQSTVFDLLGINARKR